MRATVPRSFNPDMTALIERKRSGRPNTQAELRFLLRGYLEGSIPDHQMAAWLMAVSCLGMTDEELASWTDELVSAGRRPPRRTRLPIVDMHSTGGVGDKTTLVVGPLMAMLGTTFAKMSGRSIGHTGGTIDKLESIAGFNPALSSRRFAEQAARIGLVLIEQTEEILPGDRAIYGLRDEIAALQGQALSCASIMSKKIVLGADIVVLDVKFGGGGTNGSLSDARALASQMIQLGRAAGQQVDALISDMSQPLGFAVGPALELAEAIEALSGRWIDDLGELSVEIATTMLKRTRPDTSAEALRHEVHQVLASGQAVAKLRECVVAQGGDGRVIDDPSLLPQPRVSKRVVADSGGFITGIDARRIGDFAAFLLGVSPRSASGCGIKLSVKVGAHVDPGSALADVFADDDSSLNEVIDGVAKCFLISAERVPPPALILERLDGEQL